jgi:hypothetical protein
VPDLWCAIDGKHVTSSQVFDTARINPPSGQLWPITTMQEGQNTANNEGLSSFHDRW